VAVGTVNSIKCYQCGLYKSSVSSVTPCLNLTKEHLQECPTGSKFCTKHVAPAILVYGCEVPDHDCEEGTLGYFETFCCNEQNGCNGASSISGSKISQWIAMSIPLIVASHLSLGIFHPLNFHSSGSLV
ncbi:unnamed protein product, partial [Allacma fusca]